jgi:hypothetical protein
MRPCQDERVVSPLDRQALDRTVQLDFTLVADARVVSHPRDVPEPNDTDDDAGRDACAVEIKNESMTRDSYAFRARQANVQLAWSSPNWVED